MQILGEEHVFLFDVGVHAAFVVEEDERFGHLERPVEPLLQVDAFAVLAGEEGEVVGEELEEDQEAGWIDGASVWRSEGSRSAVAGEGVSRAPSSGPWTKKVGVGMFVERSTSAVVVRMRGCCPDGMMWSLREECHEQARLRDASRAPTLACGSAPRASARPCLSCHSSILSGWHARSESMRRTRDVSPALASPVPDLVLLNAFLSSRFADRAMLVAFAAGTVRIRLHHECR